MTVTINRQTVIDEVAKITAYIGVKLLDNDSKAYDRLSITDADTIMLERFWQESRGNIVTALSRIISSEGVDGDDYRINLIFSQSADNALIPTIESGLLSYCVQYITGCWLSLAGNDKADNYLAKAASTLTDVRHKILCKRAPVRPTIIPKEIDGTERRILLYREELLYDIENICNIEAQCLESKDIDSNQPYIISDVCGGNNINHVLRIIATMYAHAAELLYPLAQKKSARIIIDNLSSSPETYDIVLRQDCSVSNTALVLISNLIHLYIVYRTVAEWLSASNPTASTKWADKAAIIAAEIRTSVTSIDSLPRRRRSAPF